ncbi:hypothetical protein PMAYCL1PPCAC_03698, partial [Pristionchus mayeri]
QYLHSRSPAVIHRDRKTENLLVSTEGFGMIGDLGSAREEKTWSSDEEAFKKFLRKWLNGATIRVQPPEVCSPERGVEIDRRSDVWGIAGAIIEMGMAAVMHDRPDEKTPLFYTLLVKQLPHNVEYECLQQILDGTLEPDPAKRLTAEQVVQKLEALAREKNIDLKGNGSSGVPTRRNGARNEAS